MPYKLFYQKKFIGHSIFSETLGNKYLTTDAPVYILLDKDLKIKRIFFQLNQEIVDKWKKELK
jgi:hypothetical protein